MSDLVLQELKALLDFAYLSGKPDVAITTFQLRRAVDRLEALTDAFKSHVNEVFERERPMDEIGACTGALAPSRNRSRMRAALGRELRKILSDARLRLADAIVEREKNRYESFKRKMDEAVSRWDFFEFAERVPIPFERDYELKLFEGRMYVPIRILTIQANPLVRGGVWRVKFRDLETRELHLRLWSPTFLERIIKNTTSKAA